MSLKDLPILTDYDISPVSGFLPAEEPLQILPDPYFAPWEETFQQFNGLLLASRLRQRVNEVKRPCLPPCPLAHRRFQTALQRQSTPSSLCWIRFFFFLFFGIAVVTIRLCHALV